ncbi:MAG: DUF2019 domain-containing protein [Afipia sp.]|nr:DUF2019 domain-containing protein [Afipia sp.]
MKKVGNQEANVDELVERFNAIALEQFDANWKLQTARYNRLYEKMAEIRAELKSRNGDQRRALIPLLESGNIQVRLMAANTLLAIAPDRARKALESVRDYGQLPQAADASMMLDALENGSFIPS